MTSHQTLDLSHYKLDASQYEIDHHAIALCAKSSPVKDITARYIKTKSEQNNPIDGHYHIVLIEGDVLDRYVNEQRDNFDEIPDEVEGGDLVSDCTVSFEAIFDAIDEIIGSFVSPSDWTREQVVEEMLQQFGIVEGMLLDTETRIRVGDTPKSVVERVLKKYQDRIINETSEIFNLKEEILKTEPDNENFREKINELSWKYTASLRNFDMANLSQLVVRRAAVVEVLELACKRRLDIQNDPKSKRNKHERLIHSVFFPMRKDSDEISDHDIWLLSEEYHYYDYIASDKPLAQIEFERGVKLFDTDIDEEFARILQKRSDDNSAKRPDIALFNKEGSAIIVEFKAPGVSMDDHVGDLSEYAYCLASKSGGRIRKIYGYLIGDTVNNLRINDWTPFPEGNGYFKTSPLPDPITRENLGQLYSEILYYGDVVERAKKRIGVYQERLNLKI